MSSYPKNLSYAVRRLSNYSCNYVKVLPLNSTTVGDSGSLVFRLPNTGILDMDSWAVYFNAACAGGGGTFAALPMNAESLIESIMVTINGQVVQQPHNDYGSLFNYKINQTVGNDHQASRCVIQGGYEIEDVITADQTAIRMCWADWLGYLQELEPKYIIADLLGNTEITIRLKPAAVLATSDNNNTTASFTLSDIFGTINICQIQDGVFNSAIMARLSEQDEAGQELPIQIPYKQYYYFTENNATGAKNLKFSVASQSIDKVHHTNVLQIHRTAGAMIPDVAQAKTSMYYQFIANDCTELYLQVNGSNYPSYNISEAAMTFIYSQHALGSLHDVNAGSLITNFSRETAGTIAQAQTQFTDGRWYWTYSFEHNSEDDRLISGMNSFGQNQMMFVNAQDGGAGTEAQALLFIETTATLNVLSGKRLAVTA